ncbi:4-nitrophenyl phosphatase [uncultured bacterium]|jgi:NagD protein|nr:4-nitrophenyl phosphatase [uncultured bacterium]
MSAPWAPDASTPARLYGAYIFDIDGTICLGESLLPTVTRTIDRLRSLGLRTLFLSNNTTSSAAGYGAELTALGVPTSVDDVVNAAQVLIAFLQRELPGGSLHVIGEEALIADLREAGFVISSRAAEIDAVIASFDRGFTYAKLQLAFDALRRGARFFATNADRYRPTAGGGEPDAAAVIAAIEACTGVTCEAIVGKPSPLTVDYLRGRIGVPVEECLMVGDRLETDIRMAIDAGMSSALVLTGATSESMVARSATRPTYLLRNLLEVLPARYR